MTVQVAIYARQSLDASEGIERQMARTRAEADKRGWAVAGEYIDNDVSASKARGPKTRWAQMLSDAQRGEFTHVLSVDLDRLIRRTADLLTLMELDMRVVTIDGEIDLSTADGEFRATTLAAVARFEVRRKSERQLRANAQRIAKGRPVPGRRRYGYEGDNMTPREPEASDVRALFDAFNAGSSIRSLAGDRGWRNLRVRETLQNASYAGYVKHLGQFTKSDLIVPLVSQEVFDKAQSILSDPARKTTPGSAVKHLASGIAVCGACGSRMLFMRSYRCKQDAGHPSIIKDSLDEVVREAVVAALTFGPASIVPEADGYSLASVVAAVGKIAERRSEVLGWRDEELISPTEAKAKLVALKAEEDTLIERRQRIERESVAASMLTDLRGDLFTSGTVKLDDVAQVKDALRERWAALDLDKQRALMRDLISVTVHPGRGSGRVEVTHKVVTSLNETEDEEGLVS